MVVAAARGVVAAARGVVAAARGVVAAVLVFLLVQEVAGLLPCYWKCSTAAGISVVVSARPVGGLLHGVDVFPGVFFPPVVIVQH